MRKLISLGFVALFLLAFSGYVSAGNVDDCNSLKKKNIVEPDVYIPGLYGLCVAWYNAKENDNENALIKIEQNYSEKSGGDSVPGSGGGGEDPVFACPCWTELSEQYICDLGAPIIPGLNLFNESEFPDVYQGILVFMPSDGVFENFGVAEDLSECSHTVTGVGITDTNLTRAQGLICGYEIGEIAGLNATAICAVGG